MKNHYEEVCEIIQQDLYSIEQLTGEAVTAFNVVQTEPKLYIVNRSRVFIIDDYGLREVSKMAEVHKQAIAEFSDEM